jgi:molybdopterin-containing oxidoreductase family membrane subunit
MPVLMGVFDQPDHIAVAARRLKDRGYGDLETYSPAPFPEVDDAVDEKPSRVRLYTLIGGLVGVVTGYALTIWMANDWQIMLGGKPFSSIPPYTIIAFELTILFGGLMTVIGLFVNGKLPSFKLDSAYSARFSAEEFGLVVRCRDRDVAEIDGLLRDNHATEVSVVES